MISLKSLLTEGKLNEDIKKDIDKFIDKLNKQFTDQEYTVSSGGGKYVRINHKNRKGGQESAWGFIALVDNPSKGFQKGDLLKAAGYNTPAKNARGNILNGTAKYDKYSPAYLREELIAEAEMNPVKKVVNAILKKHKVDAMKTTSTSVRGFHNIKNGGYKYDGNYFLQFYKVPQDTIEKIAAEMKKAGVKGVKVNIGNISADYTKTGLSNSQFEATITERKYYVTYNKGRGQGKDLEKEFDQKTFKTTNKPKVFNSYNDAKKYAEKMEKMFRNSIGGGTAYWVSDEKMNPIKEAKSDYEVYHKSYTSAIEAARNYAEKKGYEINNDDAFTKIGVGPRKPSSGKTNRFSIELTKDGKPQRKMLHIQVYGMKNSYELNAYIQ